MRTILRLVDDGKITATSSVITLIEALSQPKRLKNQAIEKEYRELLFHSRNFVLEPITIEIAEIAAQLRAQYNIRTPDAIQLAVAIKNGCQAFLTNDHSLKRVTKLKVLLLDELM